MRIAVVGAGSWGTALADLLARHGHEVRLWARESEVVDAIRQSRENVTFFAGHVLHEAIQPSTDVAAAVDGAEMVVSAAPSHAVRDVAARIADALNGQSPLVVSVSKGLEPSSHLTMTGVLEAVLPGTAVVALSGPSFAEEVFLGRPTAVVVASANAEAAAAAQRAFSTNTFRVYTSQDALGVQLGGALKNVVAIACGILDGMELGHNPRAALITRGLAETTRLGAALGADPMTFAGLAGLGDLILTATGALSRNRTLGMELGRGRTLGEVMATRNTVAEGVNTAKVAVALGSAAGVELPIAQEVSRILFDDKSPQDAMRDLMERELKAEQWR